MDDFRKHLKEQLEDPEIAAHRFQHYSKLPKGWVKLCTLSLSKRRYSDMIINIISGENFQEGFCK